MSEYNYTNRDIVSYIIDSYDDKRLKLSYLTLQCVAWECANKYFNVTGKLLFDEKFVHLNECIGLRSVQAAYGNSTIYTLQSMHRLSGVVIELPKQVRDILDEVIADCMRYTGAELLTNMYDMLVWHLTQVGQEINEFDEVTNSNTRYTIFNTFEHSYEIVADDGGEVTVLDYRFNTDEDVLNAIKELQAKHPGVEYSYRVHSDKVDISKQYY